MDKLTDRIGNLEGRLFESLVENSADLIGIATLDGDVFYMNPAGRALVGLDDAPLAHRIDIREFTHEKHFGKLRDLLSSLLETGSWTGEMRIRNVRTGALIPVETRAFLIRDPETGTPAAMASVSRDLSDRIRVEDALRVSEDKFSKAFHISPDAVNINRLRDGMFIEVNEGFCRTTGYAPGEVIGKTSLEMSLWDRPEDRAEVVRRLEADGEVRNFEAKFRMKGGAVVTGLMSAKVLDIAGEPCILSITRDITERVRLEEELRQAQKMEAVGRLAGGIAHDFNNLLTAILGFSELLESRLPPGDPSAHDIGEIRKAGESAAALTRQLLAFSRKQVLDLRPAALNDLVTDTEKMLRRVIGEDITLSTRLADDLWNVRADRNQVEQVLMNLAVNARDAMPGGGTLTIGTRNVMVGESAPGRPAECPPGPYAVLSVGDTGQGMDEETSRRIFEPFFTTKEKGKGTGLGLSTVDGIVRQSGGFVEVATRPGQGTTFRVYLPRVDEPSEPASAATAAAKPGKGGETVLLVEDSGTVRSYILDMLRMDGYAVLEASSGEEALRVAEERRGPVDLLVTDMVMPGIDGIELAGRLRALRPGLKVLFISGCADDFARNHIPQDSTTRFLGKPFKTGDLLRKIREVLDG